MNGLPFNKLTEEQKEKALEACRYINVENEGWADFILDCFSADMDEEYGIFVDPKKFTWRLHCQGANATFEGYLHDSEKYFNKMYKKEEHPDLYRQIRFIINDSPAGFYTENSRGWQKGYIITTSSYNLHDPEISFESVYDETGRIVGSKPVGKVKEHWQAIENAREIVENDWNAFCQDKAQELYNMIDNAFNSFTSDEAVQETIESNNFLFLPTPKGIILI